MLAVETVIRELAIRAEAGFLYREIGPTIIQHVAPPFVTDRTRLGWCAAWLQLATAIGVNEQAFENDGRGLGTAGAPVIVSQFRRLLPTAGGVMTIAEINKDETKKRCYLWR